MSASPVRIAFFLAVLALAIIATPATSQTERSPVLAGALELVVPTAGFGYAGDWSRGLLPNVVRIGSLAGILATDACDSQDGSDAACAALAATLAISHIWATVGAVNTARDRNRALRGASPGLALLPGPASGSLSVGLVLTH